MARADEAPAGALKLDSATQVGTRGIETEHAIATNFPKGVAATITVPRAGPTGGANA